MARQQECLFLWAFSKDDGSWCARFLLDYKTGYFSRIFVVRDILLFPNITPKIMVEQQKNNGWQAWLLRFCSYILHNSKTLSKCQRNNCCLDCISPTIINSETRQNLGFKQKPTCVCALWLKTKKTLQTLKNQNCALWAKRKCRLTIRMSSGIDLSRVRKMQTVGDQEANASHYLPEAKQKVQRGNTSSRSHNSGPSLWSLAREETIRPHTKSMELQACTESVLDTHGVSEPQQQWVPQLKGMSRTNQSGQCYSPAACEYCLWVTLTVPDIRPSYWAPKPRGLIHVTEIFNIDRTSTYLLRYFGVFPFFLYQLWWWMFWNGSPREEWLFLWRE